MAKMTVEIAGITKTVKGINAAYIYAGEQAQEMLFSAPLGTTIIVRRDGVATLTRTLVEHTYNNGRTERVWHLS